MGGLTLKDDRDRVKVEQKIMVSFLLLLLNILLSDVCVTYLMLG
jgi:hypothetical protein